MSAYSKTGLLFFFQSIIFCFFFARLEEYGWNTFESQYRRGTVTHANHHKCAAELLSYG